MADERHLTERTFDALSARSLAGKREYVRSLEQRPDEEKLSLLIECLCDESWFMRGLAEESLERCGENAVPSLLPMLGQGLWFTRASAAGILGRLGSRPAIPGLVALIGDENRAVREAAKAALSRIGRAGGSAALARALHKLSPEARGALLRDLEVRDRELGERLGQLLRNDELMHADADELLPDDSPLVRQTMEGVVWEVLTGPPPSGPPEGSAEHGGAPPEPKT